MLPIFEPAFNLREVCKELALLEDHLRDPRRRCKDCITKHCLKAEAYAEEAASLDVEGALGDLPCALAEAIRSLADDLAGGCSPGPAAQRARGMRKEIQKCFGAPARKGRYSLGSGPLPSRSRGLLPAPAGQAARAFRYDFPMEKPLLVRELPRPRRRGRGATVAGDATLAYRATRALGGGFALPASFDLVIRRRRLPKRIRETNVSTPGGAAHLGRQLVRSMRLAGREWFLVLALSHRLAVEAWWVAGVGSTASVAVTPSDVFGPALALQSPRGVIVIHNHPSGSPTPSPEDHAITGRLKEAGALVGIPLLDHLVVGTDSFSSLAELGFL